MTEGYTGKPRQRDETISDPSLTLDYYRHKTNSIESSGHLDEALTIALAKLATISAKDFNSAAKNRETRRQKNLEGNPVLSDALNIKYLVQTSAIPGAEDLQFSTDTSEYANKVMSAHNADPYEDYINAQTEQVGEEIQDRIQAENQAWLDYIKEVSDAYKSGSSKINYVYNPGSGEFFFTPAGGETVARINIKTHEPDSPSYQVLTLTRLFSSSETIVDSGFAIKTLTNSTKVRDSVIIYCTEGAFTEICKILRNQFQDNVDYDDRHASPGIFGGIPLKNETGGKMQSIRVCAEPSSINNGLLKHGTFNELQSTILSEAVIDYVGQFYGGDKEQFLADYKSGNSEALDKWETDFPSFYENAAKEILGEDTNVENIAFFT